MKCWIDSISIPYIFLCISCTPFQGGTRTEIALGYTAKPKDPIFRKLKNLP